MLEKDFQTKFSTWAKHRVHKSAAFELKLSKKPSLPFSAIAPHQIQNLLTAKHRTLVYKLPDVGYDQKPFDCFVLCRSEAYLVVMFHLKRGDKEFYMIDIDRFIAHRDTSTRKSLTKEDAEQLATTKGILI